MNREIHVPLHEGVGGDSLAQLDQLKLCRKDFS